MRRTFLVFWLALAAFGAGARAASADSRAAGKAGKVLLVVAADPGETKALGQVAKELLGRLSVDVELRRVSRIDLGEVGSPSTESSYLARIFVDMRRSETAGLFFVDSAHDRILIREIARSPGSEELAREELGHIFETSTEGLLSGAEIGVPRAEALPMLEPSPPARAAPVADDHRHAGWQASLLYELQILAGPARTVQGPEAALFVRLPSRKPDLGVWLSGQYRFPVHIDGDPVGARLEGAALRAGLGLDVPLRTGMVLRAGLGGGADLVRVEPETSQSSVTLASGELLVVAVARASVGLELRLSPALSFWSRVAVDLDPSGTRYVFQRRATEDLVLRPWPVRPALALGIGFP